ncbi:MAG TPA: diguanylate cyclase [Verrucomicrobiae bacterium]|nr:diguanylate cyclase [Verrucomicrobiae bacterium]
MSDIVRTGHAGANEIVRLLVRSAETMLLAAADEGAVLRAAIDLLGERFGYEMRYILLWREKSGELEMAEAGGPASDRAEVRSFKTRLGSGLTGQCAETLQVLNARDVRKDPRYLGVVGECASELCLPIAVGERLIGVLALESKDLDAFSADDEAALVAFSQLVALALIGARTAARNRQDIAVLESLNEVAAHAATLDLARTLDAAVRAFQQVTTSDSTAVYLFDADRAVLNVAALVFDPRLYPADYDESVRAKPLPIGEGMVGWCALHREATLIDDVSKDPRPRRIGNVPLASKAAIVVPLLVEERLVGVIRAVKMGIGSYSDDHYRFAKTLAHQSALAIAAAQAHEAVQELSRTDELTGLPNARAFKKRLANEVDRAHRYLRSLSLIVIDSDALKRVNDQHGHAAGDRLLAGVASALRGSIRSTDFVARYGGDEFVAILPETDLAGARVLAERMLTMLAVRDEGGTLCTVSIGIASLEAGGADDLFRSADAALYDAKRKGKNQVQVTPIRAVA